jgi:Zn-dependent alcohol dehydrogenase
MVGGHEGSGTVVETGPGVTRVKVGDRVSCSYIPVCGKCRYCSTGKQNLCDAGLYAGVGCLPDKTFRFHQNGEDFGATHAFGDPAKAKEVLIDLTRGQLADKVICTVGEMDNEWSRPNSSRKSTPWTKLTTATRILWMVRTSAASSCTSIEAASNAEVSRRSE